MNTVKNRLYLLAAVALIGIALELWVSIGREGTAFDSGLARGLNLFAFFTIWSNSAIAITSIMLGMGKTKNNLFWGLRIGALGCIGITFIIHRLFLTGPLTGIALISDTIIHVVVPFLAIGFWLYEGNKGRFTGRRVALSLLLPNTWVAFTFIRATATNYYPYTFLNIATEGLPKVVLNLLLIYSVLYVLIGALWLIDKRLSNSQ